MSVDACAALVARSDPNRFAAALTAPLDIRADLLTLYAFNLEVARAPYVTEEPMLAEMRLQWWRDVLEETYSGAEIRRHEVTTPLGEMLRRRQLPRARLDALIDARRRDIERDPPASLEALRAYLGASAGGLMVLATRITTPDLAEEGERTAFALGRASGTAQYLQALPDLIALNRSPLPHGGAQSQIKELAEMALADLEDARKGRKALPKSARPALLTAAGAEMILKRAIQDPDAALEARIALSESQIRAARLWQGLTGRW
ncbi:MAG: squalene/phytoene synthase family protein [Pseudomonadota bacterium]